MCDEETQERLPGDDTRCTITILDDDQPGVLAFEAREIEVKRSTGTVAVKILRTEGTDGDITCKIRTGNQDIYLGGDKKAEPHVDFVELHETILEFAHQESEKVVELMLLPKASHIDGPPTRTGINSEPAQEEEEVEEEEECLKFYLTMFEPKPEGVKISKKNMCLIEIIPESNEIVEK